MNFRRGETVVDFDCLRLLINTLSVIHFPEKKEPECFLLTSSFNIR